MFLGVNDERFKPRRTESELLRPRIAKPVLAVARLLWEVLLVSDTPTNRRRWSGYVCPDCRLVFRIQMDHNGRGCVCPSCLRMLRIPAPGEKLPPLVMPSPRVGHRSGR